MKQTYNSDLLVQLHFKGMSKREVIYICLFNPV